MEPVESMPMRRKNWPDGLHHIHMSYFLVLFYEQTGTTPSFPHTLDVSFAINFSIITPVIWKKAHQ